MLIWYNFIAATPKEKHMKLYSLSEITNKAKTAFQRFPVTLIWAVLGTLTCIFLIDDVSGKLLENNVDLILTLILGISWLIGTRFFIEQTDHPKKWIWLKLLVLLMLGLFYWYMPNESDLIEGPEYILRFFLFLIAGHLFVFFAPFLFKWNTEAYWNYLKSTGMSIIRSAFFSGVLFLGLVFALLAIEALFEVKIPGERFGQLFVFCAGIVNTWIYLSDFPKNIQQHLTIDFNKALEVFVKFILIPLVMLYLIILYAYSFKILVEWELPKGWVSYLVIALSLLGFIVQVIINPVQKRMKSWTIRIFHPFFYIALLPLVILLFVAIFRRIADYGITENRYFVVAIAIWILGMSLYMLFAKNRRLIVLPISLFFLAVLSSFGYWGAMGVSMRSQTNQFKNVYRIVKDNANKASAKQYEQLQSILKFMNERNSLSALNPITEIDMNNNLLDTTNTKSRWFNASDALTTLGIDLDPNDTSTNNTDGKSFNYYNNNGNFTAGFDIKDYDFFAPIQFNQYSDKPMLIGEILVQYASNKQSILFKTKTDSSELIELSLRKKLLDLAKYNSNIPADRLNELGIDFENDRILGKLIFSDLGYRIKNDSIELNHSRAFLFLKRY